MDANDRRDWLATLLRAATRMNKAGFILYYLAGSVARRVDVGTRRERGIPGIIFAICQ